MSTELPDELPLFPLGTVLFPDGLLVLKVFEARYLDMVAGCMRQQRPFGVVSLESGQEVGAGRDPVELSSTGTLAQLIDVDSTQIGILEIRCRGLRRFVIESSRRQADGLWLAKVTERRDDEDVVPRSVHENAVQSLRDALIALEEHGASPFLLPHRFDSAGWVANRWCELLPLELEARQLLMEMSDPLARLGVVDSLLRSTTALH